MPNHQNDGKAEPREAPLAIALDHAREHVLIQHQAAVRLGAVKQGSKDCSSQSLTSKPSSSSEKRKELASTPSPTAIKTVAASAKFVCFTRMFRLSRPIEVRSG